MLQVRFQILRCNANFHYVFFFWLAFRLDKSNFQILIDSYPDLLAQVEALALRRIEEILMIEKRERYRKSMTYKTINQRQFTPQRRSTSSIDKSDGSNGKSSSQSAFDVAGRAEQSKINGSLSV
jgi:hypothetical protein